MHARGEEKPIQADGYAPALTGYGSQAWLRSFIADSGVAEHYGEKSAMPAFKDQLTERELDLLVRWMAGDYHPPAAAKQ
jgi:mono/diheme cytochrome c family protein